MTTPRRRLCNRLGVSDDIPDDALEDLASETLDTFEAIELEAGLPHRREKERTMKPGDCPHKQTGYMRVIGKDGRTHIAEVCRDCGGNARGAGQWVAASKTTIDPATLPLWRDLRTAGDRGEQRGLFDEETP